MSTDDPMPDYPHRVITEEMCSAEVVELARDLYGAYTANSGNKNYQGLPCPEWDKLPPAIRGHWCCVAMTAYGMIGLRILGLESLR